MKHKSYHKKPPVIDLLKKILFCEAGYFAYGYEYTYHIVCLSNSYYWNCFANSIIMYYPRTYADIFCMGFCCNSPLLGRKGVSENEIF